jgi:hypothetical protein
MRLIYLFLLAVSASAADWYASPTGADDGLGTLVSPWSIRSALTNNLDAAAVNTAVTDGDTIWLVGGTYAGVASLLSSTDINNPIKVRPVSGARVTIDNSTISAAIRAFGANVWFMDLELMSSSTDRTTDRKNGVDFISPGSKVINCIVHDCGTGILPNSTSVDSEVYGCVIYNNGWQGVDRGHGHAIYAQNSSGTMMLRDNFGFNNYGNGIQAFGVSGQCLGITMRRNVLFNSGAPSTAGTYPNIIVTPTIPADAIAIETNYLFTSASFQFETTAEIGANNTSNLGLTMVSNYLGGGFVLLREWATATVSSNSFNGTYVSMVYDDLQPFPAFTWDYNLWNKPYPQVKTNGVNIQWADWQAKGYDVNSTLNLPSPSATNVYAWQNFYNTNRIHVVAYNWSSASTVTVDLTGLVSNGRRYVVRNVQNYYGGAIASGVYSGPFTLPTSGLSVATPVGATAPAETGPIFNAFIVDVGSSIAHATSARVGSLKGR